jgi:hypothetical protein
MKMQRALLAVTLLLSAGALALAAEERLTREDREDEAEASTLAQVEEPTLTIRYVDGPGAFAAAATHVPPSDFGGDNAVCPDGFEVIGGGASIAGPGIITGSEVGGPQVWRVEIFNATTETLGFSGTEGDPNANLSVEAVCLGGDGIQIETRGAQF